MTSRLTPLWHVAAMIGLLSWFPYCFWCRAAIGWVVMTLLYNTSNEWACVCLHTLTSAGCRESVFQKTRSCLTPTYPTKQVCFSNVRWWRYSEVARWREYDYFSRKMEWKEKKGVCKERWRLLSIIKLAHSPDRRNSEALSLCWSIPLLWEDGQHNKLPASTSISSFLSVFCSFFICLLVIWFLLQSVFLDNWFSLHKTYAMHKLSWKFLYLQS